MRNVLTTSINCLWPASQTQPISFASPRISLITYIVIGPVFVVIQSLISAQILQARSILQGRILNTPVHTKPVPVLHTVSLRGAFCSRRLIPKSAIVWRWHMTSVGVSPDAWPRYRIIWLVAVRGTWVALCTESQIIGGREINLLRLWILVAMEAFARGLVRIVRIVRTDADGAMMLMVVALLLICGNLTPLPNAWEPIWSDGPHIRVSKALSWICLRVSGPRDRMPLHQPAWVVVSVSHLCLFRSYLSGSKPLNCRIWSSIVNF